MEVYLTQAFFFFNQSQEIFFKNFVISEYKLMLHH